MLWGSLREKMRQSKRPKLAAIVSEDSQKRQEIGEKYGQEALAQPVEETLFFAGEATTQTETTGPCTEPL